MPKPPSASEFRRQMIELVRAGGLGQHTSLALGQRCAKLAVRTSMGSVGDSYDNAMAESVFASRECKRRDYEGAKKTVTHSPALCSV